MWSTKWKYKSKVSIMSGSPRPLGSFDEEMLFPDDMSPIPPRPQQLVRPAAKRFLPVPGKRIRPEHVSIPVAPPIFVPIARIPGFHDSTGRKLRTSPSAFRINPYSEVGSPLRKGEMPARAQGPYMPSFDNSTRRIERREPAVSLNIDSEVTSPLRSTKKAGRSCRSIRRKARGFRSRKASRLSTRATLRR